MNNDQFIRYKALDRCFRDNYGSYTIMDLVESCTKAVCDFHGDYERSVARRTVELDIAELKLRYDIELRDDLRQGHKKIYKYVDTSFSLMQKLLADGELEQMMLQNVLDTLLLYDDIPQYKWLYMFIQQRINGIKAENTQAIAFQNNPDLLGMEHFDVLLNAILKKQPLKLSYKKYQGETKEYLINPYLLKQFNDRWFLIAKTEGYSNLSNYAIDRIVEIKNSDTTYIPVEIDLMEYLDDVIGVSRDERKPIEDVVIRISKTRYPYIETKPFHPSQRRVRDMDDDNSIVIKIHVQVNREFEAMILSLGNDAEVLSPTTLRESIKQKVEDLSKKYSCH